MLRVPWMPGENDIDQLGKIFQVFGTPTDEDWPDHEKLPSFIPFRKTLPVPLSQIFPQVSSLLACFISTSFRHLMVHLSYLRT